MWAMRVTNYLGGMQTVKGHFVLFAWKVLIKTLHHHRSQGSETVVRVMVSVNSEPINLGFNVRLSLSNLLFEIGPWNIKGMGSPIHRSRVIAPLNCLIGSTVFVQESHVCTTDQAT